MPLDTTILNKINKLLLDSSPLFLVDEIVQSIKDKSKLKSLISKLDVSLLSEQAKLTVDQLVSVLNALFYDQNKVTKLVESLNLTTVDANVNNLVILSAELTRFRQLLVTLDGQAIETVDEILTNLLINTDLRIVAQRVSNLLNQVNLFNLPFFERNLLRTLRDFLKGKESLLSDGNTGSADRFLLSVNDLLKLLSNRIELLPVQELLNNAL